MVAARHIDLPLGRPSSLTPTVQTAILTALRAGHKRKAACALAGITYQTFQNWQTRNNQNECSDYADFFAQVYDAEQMGIAIIAQRVIDATTQDWRAGVKWLALKDPEEYSEQRQLRVLHEGTVTHVHTLQSLSRAEANELAGLLTPRRALTLDSSAIEIIEQEP